MTIGFKLNLTCSVLSGAEDLRLSPRLSGQRQAGRRRRGVRRDVLHWRVRRIGSIDGNDCQGGRYQQTRMTGRQRAAGLDEAARQDARPKPGRASARCSPGVWGEADARAQSNTESCEVMRAGAGPARVEAWLTRGWQQGGGAPGAGLRQQLRGCEPSVDKKRAKGRGARMCPARKFRWADGGARPPVRPRPAPPDGEKRGRGEGGGVAAKQTLGARPGALAPRGPGTQRPSPMGP